MGCCNPHTNARDVLPPELMEQILVHFGGGYLYIPFRKRMSRIKRDLEIYRMFNEGKSIAEIAETFLMTRRAVRYILRKEGRKDVQK